MRKLKVFLEMIKFEHTIFALPFAYIGAFLAARYQTPGGWPTLAQFIWITLAMVGARTVAMGLNRLIDRHIDAKNPRTATRALPKGLLGEKEVMVYIVISFLLMFLAAYKLNPLCVKAMPIAVFFLTIYSYSKRFTWTCHLILGITDGLAPLGGWIAITGSFDLPGLLLGLAVALWIGGFDIIYACQDIGVDRKLGLHSIPVKFGIARALGTSTALHALVVALLILVGMLLKLGLLYYVGVAIALWLLYKQHRMVSPTDLSRLNFAFFNLNGYLSVIVFLFVLLDLKWPLPLP